MGNTQYSKVFVNRFSEFKNVSRLKVFRLLLEKSGLSEMIKPQEYVAIKLHFGERGNLSYVHPQYLSVLAEYIKELKGIPFLTDTNCLNGDWRLNAVDHLHTASINGFSSLHIDAPIIIADGLKGNTCTWLKNDCKQLSSFAYGKELLHADKIIYVSHFKGHQIGGFGGAIKNVGVGSASRVGKMDIHYNFSPKINKDACTGCGKCLEACRYGAVHKNSGQFTIAVDKCVSCCDCMETCSGSAIELYELNRWNTIQERYVEYAATLYQYKKDCIYCINVLEKISEVCDCWGFSNESIVSDLGLLASQDAVAIDRCSYDLVNEMKACTDIGGSTDIFKELYPDIDALLQLRYAESLGLGCMKYKKE